LNAKTAEFHGGKQETATTTETVQEVQGSKLKKTIVTTTTTTEMAVLYLKEKAANPDAPKTGKNTLILHGSTVQQKEKGIYVAQHVVITPCDCVGEPDYVLQADEAILDGDRAHLSGTKLHFPHVTVPLFPLSLPLTNRQWGLLSPSLGSSGVAGFGFALPVFVPLGDSYDLTLSPGYFTGGTNKSAAPAAVGSRDIKGPRLGLELRYAPVQGTTGSINFDMFYDQAQHQLPHAVDTPPGGDSPAGSGRGIDGVRGVARIAHRSEGDAVIFAVQGTIATDVMVVQDSEPASLDRYVDFLRTDLGAWRARGATTAGIDATLLQDVRIPDFNEPDRRLFGADRRATFQRLPALFAQVADNPLGPLTFGLETSAVTFAPFGGPDAHERSTGFSPTDFGASLAPVLGTGSAARSQALRGDFAPRLSWSGPQSMPVELRFDAGARADGYLELGYPERDHTRAYADLGATIGLPLERRFGSLLHRIEPMLELRGITPSLQSGGPPIGDPADAGGAVYSSAIANAQQNLYPGLPVARIGACTINPAGQPLTCGVPSARRAYDEVDGAAPSTGAVEAVASLDQTLWTKSGKNAVRAVRLNLQQDVLLGSGGGGSRLGEGSATVSVQNSFASASTTFRYDWQLGALSTILAYGALRDARTDEVHAGTTLLRGATSERLRAGIDELFSAEAPDALAGALTGSWGAGGSAPLLWNLRLAYDFSKNIDSEQNPIPPNVANLAHLATISYDTPCHCAAVSLAVALPFHDSKLIGGPSIRFLLDLKSLGSFATF
jgi:LPS-assembly protein